MMIRFEKTCLVPFQILLALVILEIVATATFMLGAADAHEAAPSDISITRTDADILSLRVTLNLAQAREHQIESTAPDDAIGEKALESLSSRIRASLRVTVAGKDVDLKTVAVWSTDSDDGVFEMTAEIGPAAQYFSISPGAVVGDSLVRLVDENQKITTRFISGGGEAIFARAAGTKAASVGEVVVDYVYAGFIHIVPRGLDHILFVVGLFLLTLQLRPLLLQVSLFTVAHTVTLALGATGFVVVPASIVEPLIAASIVFIAVENVITKDLSRWRPYVVFAFGLLHGLGFASVIAEFGLPQAHFVAGLVAFNIGVELGQIFVLALCFAAVSFWFAHKKWYRRGISIPASLMVGATGMVWTVQRVGEVL